MFERGRIDNNRLEALALPVEIELTDGTIERGKLRLASSLKPIDALNAPGNFIEFVPYTGAQRFIAKTAIVSIRLVEVDRATELAPRTTPGDEFDPHRILGVSTESSWDEVRAAYHRLSKVYHPDLHRASALPSEVVGYIEVMARRINAAYSALDTATRQQRRPRGVVSEPVFTSSPRN